MTSNGNLRYELGLGRIDDVTFINFMIVYKPVL